MVNNIVYMCLLFCVYGQVVSATSNPGGDDGYSYPCPNLDLNCIQDYLFGSGLCTKVSCNDGDRIQQGCLVGYMPSFNVFLDTYDDDVSFFGSAVDKFYVTPDKSLVMVVKFDGLYIDTARGKLRINQRDSAPIVVEDYLKANYSAVINAMIPSAGLQGLKGTTVSFYNTNPNPPFVVGPKISQSTNDVVAKTYQAITGDIPTAATELLLTKAPFFFFAYLQNYICDYGYVFTGDLFG